MNFAISLLVLMAGATINSVTSLQHKPILVHYEKARAVIGGRPMCALDDGYRRLASASLDACAIGCAKDDQCLSFKTNNAVSCDFINISIPIIVSVDHCINYQKVSSDKVDCLAIADYATSIPSKCCAVPYTVSGKLHYNCTVQPPLNDYGCYKTNRQWVACLMPDDFEAKYEETSTTVLSDDPTVSVLMVSINGWILMQRRVPGGLVSFDHDWNGYRDGFGAAAINDNYWLGLEKVYRLMQISSLKLRVEVQYRSGLWYSAEYSKFSLSDEAGKYRLSVDGYSGDAGDALAGHPVWKYRANGMKFSTPDRDHDGNSYGNCAKGQSRRCGWWYRHCSVSELNKSSNRGVWRATGTSVNVVSSRMLVKSN